MHFASAMIATLAILLPALAAAQTLPAVDPEALSRHIRVLSSDEFQGRAPGTEGEQRTIAYLTEQFRAAGAQPGGENGGWTQAVRINRYQIRGPHRLAIRGASADCSFDLGDEAIVWTRSPNTHVELSNAPLVFAGFGVNAPELSYDSYGDADLNGKVVVLLPNDPDYDQDSGPFGGRAMSYHGRFTIKIEEAARRGAAAVVILYGPSADGLWGVYRAAYSAPTSGLVGGADTRIAFSSWFSAETAGRLMRCAGQNLEEATRAARRSDFRARPLAGLTLSAAFDVSVEQTTTHNVIARIPGSRHPDETFLFTAHWDHMGIGAPDSSGDTIYNGAMDNAGGVAGLLELARTFAAGPRPERSVVFIATTLEENGLLGAEYFAANPLFPLETTVAGFNMDAVNLFGPTGTMEVTGMGKTTLEDLLERELATQGRRMQDDPNSVVGFYYRSDHFPFARRGVPFIFAGSGWELVPERAPNSRDPQIGTRFHQPSDEWRPEFDFAAAARDITLYQRIAARLANSRDWPGWKPGAEFAAIRAQSEARRR